jgi:diguanylate cyclase (GGDEF)-like protein
VQAELTHLALHDALTGLPNRKGLQGALGAALAMARRLGGLVAVHAFDLDRFKEVNDTLGHAAGDALLREVAARLRAAVRTEDTVARLGGDEFVVVQVGLAAAADAVALAERMAASLAEPYDLEGNRVLAGASIGLALAPQDAEEGELLLRRADTALYRAKAMRRGGVVCFAPGMDAELETRRALERDLRAALARGEFHLEYQPLYALTGRTLLGQEALLRWQHPVRGRLAPAEFVPLAETMGLMGGIGNWVLRTACAEAAGWSDGATVAVNLSPTQFQQGDIVGTVRAALAASGLAPARLELEITEGLLLEDSEAVIAALRGLKALGVRIVMDDFGTGYSALAYLWRFPFDKLKIDGSFVRRLPSDPKVAAVVGTIVSLGRTLNLRVTAEGVESEEQLRAVMGAGCDEGQGFWLGRPGPALDGVAEEAAA